MLKFNYTHDADRKKFASFLGSLDINKLVSLINLVPWRKYSFDDNSTLLMCSDCGDDDSQTHSVAADATTDNDNYIVEHVKAKCEDKPYLIIGGAVYYLLTQECPDINHFMDPTGDVDIQIALPIIYSIDSTKKGLENYINTCIKKNKKGDIELNEIMSHYMTWLLNEIYNLFDQHFPDIYEDLDEYDYDTENFYTKNIKNKVHFSLIREAKMLKVQIECKPNNVTRPDHLMELVIIIPEGETLDVKGKFNKLGTNLNDLFIQKFDVLINHNINSITNRLSLSKDSMSHKLHNHLARLQYLNYIYNDHPCGLSQTGIISKYTNYKIGAVHDQIKFLIYFLWENKKNIEAYNYTNLQHNDFLLSMISNYLDHLKIENRPKPILITTGPRKYKNFSNTELVSMFDISRGRSLFKKRTFTQKSTITKKSATQTRKKSIHRSSARKLTPDTKKSATQTRKKSIHRSSARKLTPITKRTRRSSFSLRNLLRTIED